MLPLRNSDWILKGIFGGRLIKAADSAISAISSDTSVCIKVLDSVCRDESLVTSLTFQSWIEDVKIGRIGREWRDERYAIANHSYETFSEFWPFMRRRLTNALLVSEVSNLENYVISLMVEFPAKTESLDSSETDSEATSDYLWQIADSAYRNAVKSTRSTSKAWVRLCSESSIPDIVKLDVVQWIEEGNGFVVDEMVLLRNSIVHQSGIAGKQLAKLLGVRVGDSVYATDQRVIKYRDAYFNFLSRIDSPL